MEWPKFKRIRWIMAMLLVFLLGGLGCEGCWEQEKMALLQLKPFFYRQWDAFNGGKSHSLYNWLEEGEESSDCCKWESVECDATTGRVIGLSLTNKFGLEEDLRFQQFNYPWLQFWQQQWFLNASVFLPFEDLKTLSLSHNRIAGCLDNYGFEKLTSKLNKLEVLDLSFNHFTDGNILSSSFEFSSLKFLNLSHNELTGPIHTNEFGGLSTKLSTIQTLDLNNNQLNDSVLLALGELPSLKYLDLSSNQIIGSSLKDLNFWDMGSAAGFRGLSRLKSLETLYLNGNYELEITSILSHLGNLSSLKTLGLESCNIDETAQIQELNNLINLEELYLSGNDIKSLGSFLGIEDERQSGLINVEVLSLTLNVLNNSIVYSSLGPFSKSLKHLHFLMDGVVAEGSIDIEDARARNLKNLKGVDLVAVQATNNSILPEALGIFPSLKSLQFDFNSFDKTVTIQELRNLTNLEELFVEYSFLPTSFLEDVGKLTSLRILSLLYCTSSGSLPIQDICELTSLEELVINGNIVKGILPDCFSNLTFLRHLDLSSNQLSGTMSPLVSLGSIDFIDLSNNQFQIPSSLIPFYNHSKLKHFNGDNNHIFVETELHSLAPRFQLNFISLSCCGNGGTLPKFLHHQHELQYVGLSNINLTGEFPSWLLENNTQLETLLLVNNSLSRNLRLPLIHSPMRLSELDISNNFFDGHIPIQIGAYLPGLTFLNMSQNALDGGIPSSIGDLKVLETLDLSINRLSGRIPESLAMNCSSLIVLSLSNNHLQGQMLSSNFNLTNLVQLQLAGNNFTGVIPNSLNNCSLLSTIDIGFNHISGRIPRWMGNHTALNKILMPDNQLEGPIPIEFCNISFLGVLDLSMNNISGTVPSCFNPILFNHLHLSKNRLRGSIPSSLCEIYGLVTLDLSDNQLSGNIPDCIGKLSNLSYLVLSHNNLEGEIPIQCCDLKKLSLIALSQNNLSGAIPSCLNVTAYEEIAGDSIYYNAPFLPFNALGPLWTRFTSDGSMELTIKNISYSYKGKILRFLSGIDLSFNKLIGEIPHQMGNFNKIIMLNLSHNSLTGEIPPSLSNLREVESLDLSYNNLSGRIPPQFVNLYSLVYFNVSYNNLSGNPPPRAGQFASNIDENSYWGNPSFCIECLLPNKSSTIKPPSNSIQDDGEEDHQEDDGFIDVESFYLTFGVSYIMVLLGFAAVLCINPYWRGAWFYFVEKFISTCIYFVIDNVLPRRFRFCYI